MCLYTKRILNKRFIPTRKNGYEPPICTDERLRYIDIECGHCYECKRKKAREWRTRMSEELKTNPKAIFFTGTFTDKRIEKISKKYNIPQEDVNAIATKETRLFMERLRRVNKGKSIKHWITTEKGHNNTRRIHIHGIFWHEDKRILSKLLKENWIAGYSYQGIYVNEKTINYIVKYMTKTDLENQDYESIVLCSPGIGKNFINSYNGKQIKYIPKTKTEETIQYYRFKNGTKTNLPRYYKLKLFTEKERELLWIERQESGEKYVMGEKFIVKNEYEQKQYENVVKYYRRKCTEVHKDNPLQWEKNKWHNKHKNHTQYLKKWQKEKETYLKKAIKADIAFQKDIEQFSHLHVMCCELRS